MTRPTMRIYFDFIDPLSYAVSRVLSARPGSGVEWVGFELRPPPSQLTGAGDPMWAARREKAQAWGAPLRVPWEVPRVVPWTRKAHELHLLACERGAGEAIRTSILEAFFTLGRDIGRVDVLVDIAFAAGLDRTETKAVLDVDRHEPEVTALRLQAEAGGVSDVPALSVDGRLVEGFPDITDLGTLLPDP